MPVAKRTLRSPVRTRANKRRRTTKQVTFHDDEGDTVTFRINATGNLVELVNGKQTLGPVTIMSINESTGRIEDDDGPNDGFNLKELNKLPELRDLCESATGLTLDWIAKDNIEDPVKPIEDPVKPIEEPVKPKAASPAKKSPAKRKPRKTRSRSRSKSRTPRKPRAPKVWDPITFMDEEGDKITFSLTAEGFLQEKVNDKVTLAKVGRLSINTALSRIVDDDGVYDAFRVKETDKLGHLRDMCLHAMDLNLSWSTEAPTPEAWCSIM